MIVDFSKLTVIKDFVKSSCYGMVERERLIGVGFRDSEGEKLESCKYRKFF